MPRARLSTIERQIKALQAKAEKIKRADGAGAIREIVGLMRSHDITIAELQAAIAGGRGRGGRRKPSALTGRKVEPMYRNPKTGETWSGRGRTAGWLAALEKAGRKRDAFLIRKS
jgi:DNA-binding protein H-NS